MNRFQRSPNRGREGSALLVVLVMLGVIAILAAAVARSVSGAALELSAARTSAESESDLRAGIELGVAAILKLGDDMRSAEASANLHGRRITVRVTNERARIDLNRAKLDLLTGLLKSTGLDDTESASLATNIVEWRGGATDGKTRDPLADDHHFAMPRSVNFDSPMGAAPKQAQAKTPSVHMFDHPAQLVSVPGFSRDLVRRLFPFLTVANGANEINPFIAGPGVLNALPGATPDSVAAFLEARDGNVSRKTAIQLLGVDPKQVSDDAAGGWRLRITSAGANRVHHSEAIVAAVNGDSDQPYGVLYVLDDAEKSQ